MGKVTLSLTPGKPFSWRWVYLGVFPPPLSPFLSIRPGVHHMSNSAPDTGQRGWSHHGLKQWWSAQRTKGGARPHPSRTQVYIPVSGRNALNTSPLRAENLSCPQKPPGHHSIDLRRVLSMKLAAKLKLLPKTKHRLISVSGWLEHRLWL